MFIRSRYIYIALSQYLYLLPNRYFEELVPQITFDLEDNDFGP